jgi:hypothetical protein
LKEEAFILDKAIREIIENKNEKLQELLERLNNVKLFENLILPH